MDEIQYAKVQWESPKDVEVIEVIRTRLKLKGDGKKDPYRIITQYWMLDGTLLAEVDPQKSVK